MGGAVELAGEVGVTLDEPGRERGEHAGHIVGHENLPVARGRGADADGRRRDLGRDRPRQRLDDVLEHDREGAGFGDRAGIGAHLLGLGRVAAVHAEPAALGHRLRPQADVPHHRDALRGEHAHGFGEGRAALDLDRRAAGLGDDPRCRLARLRRRGLVAAERQVDDDARAPRGADDRAAVGDHHVEGHAARAVETVDHHGQRITDEQQIDVVVEDLGHRRGVRGEADDRGSALALDDLRNGDAADAIGCVHGQESLHDGGARGATLSMRRGATVCADRAFNGTSDRSRTAVAEAIPSASVRQPCPRLQSRHRF